MCLGGGVWFFRGFCFLGGVFVGLVGMWKGCVGVCELSFWVGWVFWFEVGCDFWFFWRGLCCLISICGVIGLYNCVGRLGVEGVGYIGE